MSPLEVLLSVLALGGWGLVLYSYLGYPLLLALWAALHQLGQDLRYVSRKLDRRQPEPLELPCVAVVIAAYNEERHIAARVRNLLEQDYPADKLRIYIGSDGSQDRTAEILRSFQDERLQPQIFERNRGKASVLNDLRTQTREPIVVFSDANTFFEHQAIRKLVRWFQDPTVGGVTGELRLLGNDGENQDSLYWRMEQALKYFEGRIGALLGANGAIYAVRRELWPALPANAICDDFIIGMQIPVTGHRLAYDPTAWAEEDTPSDIAEEYHRRLRIGIGNFQSLFEHPEFITRTNWATKFSYVSHKVLRWTTPHLLLTSLVATLLLAATLESAHAIPWRAWAGIQLVGYAAVSLWYRRSLAGSPLPRHARLPTFFFALNWAFLLASIRYFHRSQQGTWRRTTR